MIQPPGHHLAELNWGRLRYGWDDPRTAPFVDGLEIVYQVAERHPGFMWRLDDDAMETEQLSAMGAFQSDPLVASTLSLWRDAESFVDFTLNTLHGRFMAQAADWFRAGESGMVLWWQPQGSLPTVTDGRARYARMRDEGEGPHGFGWADLGVTRGDNPRHARP